MSITIDAYCVESPSRWGQGTHTFTREQDAREYYIECRGSLVAEAVTLDGADEIESGDHIEMYKVEIDMPIPADERWFEDEVMTSAAAHWLDVFHDTALRVERTIPMRRIEFIWTDHGTRMVEGVFSEISTLTGH